MMNGKPAGDRMWILTLVPHQVLVDFLRWESVAAWYRHRSEKHADEGYGYGAWYYQLLLHDLSSILIPEAMRAMESLIPETHCDRDRSIEILEIEHDMHIWSRHRLAVMERAGLLKENSQ